MPLTLTPSGIAKGDGERGDSDGKAGTKKRSRLAHRASSLPEGSRFPFGRGNRRLPRRLHSAQLWEVG